MQIKEQNKPLIEAKILFYPKRSSKPITAKMKKCTIFCSVLLLLTTVAIAPGNAASKSSKGRVAVIVPPKDSFKQTAMLAFEQDFFWIKEYLQENNCKAEKVELNTLLMQESIQIEKSYRGVIILFFHPYPDVFWKKLKKYVRNGGKVFWSGQYGIYQNMRWSDIAEEFFGLHTSGFYTDVKIGSSEPIDTHMWIKAKKHRFFRMCPERFYAVFEGEGVIIHPTSGKVIGKWRNRKQNREEDSAAIIVTKNSRGGKTVFFGFYAINIIREGDGLNAAGLEKLVENAFHWLGFLRNTSKKKR